MRAASGSTTTPRKVHLAGFGFRLRERFLYEYDFYDLWEHRLEKVLPWKGRLWPVCTGGRRLAPPEDCGGGRAYVEQGDRRWREWSDAWPREDWALLAEILQRVLDSDGAIAALVADRERLLAALERVKAHRDTCPDRLDRSEVNQRLRQYACGEVDEYSVTSSRHESRHRDPH
jgi:hypothetical protein